MNGLLHKPLSYLGLALLGILTPHYADADPPAPVTAGCLPVTTILELNDTEFALEDTLVITVRGRNATDTDIKMIASHGVEVGWSIVGMDGQRYISRIREEHYGVGPDEHLIIPGSGFAKTFAIAISDLVPDGVRTEGVVVRRGPDEPPAELIRWLPPGQYQVSAGLNASHEYPWACTLINVD